MTIREAPINKKRASQRRETQQNAPWYHSVSAENRPFSGHGSCPSSVTGSPVRVYSSLPPSGLREFQAAAPGRAETDRPAVSHRPTALWRDLRILVPFKAFALWVWWYYTTPPLLCQRVKRIKNRPDAAPFAPITPNPDRRGRNLSVYHIFAWNTIGRKTNFPLNPADIFSVPPPLSFLDIGVVSCYNGMIRKIRLRKGIGPCRRTERRTNW